MFLISQAFFFLFTVSPVLAAAPPKPVTDIFWNPFAKEFNPDKGGADHDIAWHGAEVRKHAASRQDERGAIIDKMFEGDFYDKGAEEVLQTAEYMLRNPDEQYGPLLPDGGMVVGQSFGGGKSEAWRKAGYQSPKMQEMLKLFGPQEPIAGYLPERLLSGQNLLLQGSDTRAAFGTMGGNKIEGFPEVRNCYVMKPVDYKRASTSSSGAKIRAAIKRQRYTSISKLVDIMTNQTNFSDNETNLTGGAREFVFNVEEYTTVMQNVPQKVRNANATRDFFVPRLRVERVKLHGGFLHDKSNLQGMEEENLYWPGYLTVFGGVSWDLDPDTVRVISLPGIYMYEPGGMELDPLSGFRLGPKCARLAVTFTVGMVAAARATFMWPFVKRIHMSSQHLVSCAQGRIFLLEYMLQQVKAAFFRGYRPSYKRFIQAAYFDRSHGLYDYLVLNCIMDDPNKDKTDSEIISDIEQVKSAGLQSSSANSRFVSYKGGQWCHQHRLNYMHTSVIPAEYYTLICEDMKQPWVNPKWVEQNVELLCFYKTCDLPQCNKS